MNGTKAAREAGPSSPASRNPPDFERLQPEGWHHLPPRTLRPAPYAPHFTYHLGWGASHTARNSGIAWPGTRIEVDI